MKVNHFLKMTTEKTEEKAFVFFSLACYCTSLFSLFSTFVLLCIMCFFFKTLLFMLVFKDSTAQWGNYDNPSTSLGDN